MMCTREVSWSVNVETEGVSFCGSSLRVTVLSGNQRSKWPGLPNYHEPQIDPGENKRELPLNELLKKLSHLGRL